MNSQEKDILVAAIPTTASFTLSQINSVIGIIGGLIGIAYLIWKWRKEANRP
jgi:hypothetical protein